MNSNFSILLFFSFFFVGSLNAQLEKGDYFNTPTFGLGYSIEGPNKLYQFDQNISSSYAKMVSKSVMLGLGISLNNGSFRRYFTPSNVTTVDPFFSYEIAGLLRLYLGTEKFAPYIFISPSYGKRSFRKSRRYNRVTNEELFSPYVFYFSDNSEQKRFDLDFGLGLNYFFTPNIALESNFGIAAFNKNASNFNSPFRTEGNRFYMNSSFVFLFKPGEEKTTVPLKDRYLKAGNILVSGRLFRSRTLKNSQDELSKNSSLNIETNYFLGSRTVGILRLTNYKNTEKFNSNTFINSQSTLGVGAKHFFTLNSNLFLSVKGEIISGMSRYNFEDQQRSIFIPVAIDINYFKKQTRYYFGSEYRQESFTFIINNSNSKQKSLDIYTGFEYFFRPSFYLRGQLTNYMYTDILDEERKLPKLIDNIKWLRFSMSFGFMIN